MAYEMKPNSGSLFSNKDKPDRKENGPDYSGAALIEGVDMWLDAWLKKSSGGVTYMSLSFKPKGKQRPAAPVAAPVPPADMDDVPW